MAKGSGASLMNAKGSGASLGAIGEIFARSNLRSTMPSDMSTFGKSVHKKSADMTHSSTQDEALDKCEKLQKISSSSNLLGHHGPEDREPLSSAKS